MSPRDALLPGALVTLSVASAILLARCTTAPAVPIGAEGPAATAAAPAPPSPPPSAAPKDWLGVLVARNAVDIAPRYEGRLSAVHVRLGDTVREGSLVATLDVPSLRFDLGMAQAAAQSAKIDEERAAVELAQAEEHLARRKTLSEAALATGEDLSAATYQEKLARTRVEAARAMLAEKGSRVGQLRQRTADSEIRAPFEGIVAARYLDPGANVTPQTPIVRLISARDLFARFAVPEETAPRLSVGRAVRVAAGTVSLAGTIAKIAPEIDAASRMVVIEAQVDVGAAEVRAGEMVHVSLEVSR